MAKQAQHAPSPQGGTPPSIEESASPVGNDEPSKPAPDTGRGSAKPIVEGPGLGELLGFSEEGYPIVSLRDGEATLEAPTLVALEADDIGAMVLVSFVDGRSDQPVVTGRVQPPRTPTPSPIAASVVAGGPVTVDTDGETVTIEANKELVLRCGKASVRLRRDGRVEVRGIDVVSRAERANWIKGGSVAFN